MLITCPLLNKIGTWEPYDIPELSLVPVIICQVLTMSTDVIKVKLNKYNRWSEYCKRKPDWYF